MPHIPDWSDEGDDGAAHIFAPDLHDVRHLWLKGGLLALWALASFGVCYFARYLMFPVGGWPLGFWMASQGAVFVFLVIVVAYAAAMSWFERHDRPGEPHQNLMDANTPAPATLPEEQEQTFG